MVKSDYRLEVEIWLFHACAMHPAIIIGTVHSLWTWLWGRYHVPQNIFLVSKSDVVFCGTKSFAVGNMEVMTVGPIQG